MKVFDRSLVARITASAALVATMLICVSVAMLVHLDIRQAKGTLAGKADAVWPDGRRRRFSSRVESQS